MKRQRIYKRKSKKARLLKLLASGFTAVVIFSAAYTLKYVTESARALPSVGQSETSGEQSGLLSGIFMMMLRQGSPLFCFVDNGAEELEEDGFIPSGSFGDIDFISNDRSDYQNVSTNEGQPVYHDPGIVPTKPVEPDDITNPNTVIPANEKPIQAINIKAEEEGRLILQNQTKYNIDLDKILTQKPDIKIKSLDSPVVLIIHTHATEAYTEPGKISYDPNNEENRTRDIEKNVVRVGEEIKNELAKMGIKVLHDTKLHDYPSYNGSYKDALNSINSYLKKYPSIAIVLDIHRDSMITKEGVKYKLVSEIGGKNAAQVMIIAGSDTNLSNPAWRENLKFAARLQQKIEKSYPGLMRPLVLTTQRYNMHATHGSLILEIGTSGNTLDEALYSARLVAASLAELIKEMKG